MTILASFSLFIFHVTTLVSLHGVEITLGLGEAKCFLTNKKDNSLISNYASV